MGAVEPNPKFICVFQLKKTEQRKKIPLRFTPECNYEVLKKNIVSHCNSLNKIAMSLGGVTIC